jgi:hypothetical protein
MCFCSRRAYNIENMVDIKNLKNFIRQQFVNFKYRKLNGDIMIGFFSSPGL